MQLRLNKYIVAILNNGEVTLLAKMSLEAFNHYYAAPSVDVEQRAEDYASTKMGKMTGLDTAIRPLTNTQVFIRIEDAYKAGSRDLGQMEQWVSVEERLPEDSTDILFTDSINVRFGCYELGAFWCEADGGCKHTKYWMPIPSPPIK